jgi:hypothetical protein
LSSNLKDVAKYLVFQQFYDEEDKVIYDRTKKIRLLIPGVDEVVESCLLEFTQPLPLIEAKKYREYLEQLAQKVPFDVEIVNTKFEEMKSKLGEEEISETMVATFLIGEIINFLRDGEFKASVTAMKNRALERSTSPSAAAFIDTKFSKFASMNDLNISLLYNLSFLRLLVARFEPPDHPELKPKVEQMILKYTNALIEQIIRGSIYFK